MSGEPTEEQAFDAAVEWIVKHPPETRMRATVPLLVETFGLNAVGACNAIRAANAVRYGIKKEVCDDASTS